MHTKFCIFLSSFNTVCGEVSLIIKYSSNRKLLMFVVCSIIQIYPLNRPPTLESLDCFPLISHQANSAHPFLTMCLLSVGYVLCAVHGVGEARAAKAEADGPRGGGRKRMVHDGNAGSVHATETEPLHQQVTTLCLLVCFYSLLVRWDLSYLPSLKFTNLYSANSNLLFSPASEISISDVVLSSSQHYIVLCTVLQMGSNVATAVIKI